MNACRNAKEGRGWGVLREGGVGGGAWWGGGVEPEGACCPTAAPAA